MAPDSGDLAYALKLLASGQSMADASKEAGFESHGWIVDVYLVKVQLICGSD